MEILWKYVRAKHKQLTEAKSDFQSLFNVIHDQDDRIFAEYIEMFEIKTISYKQQKERTYKMANFLKKHLTVRKGSYVGLLMDNSIDWATTFWGLLMIGYKPLLLNTKLPNEVNSQVLKTMNCTTFVTSKEFNRNKIKGDFIVIPNPDDVNNENLLTEETWADEMAICTTASTLNYKICVYTGENMKSQLLNAKDIISNCPAIKRHYKHRLKLLAFLPLYHIFGFVATYLWFSLFGRTMVFLSNYSSDTILYTIRKCEVTHIFSIPMFWNAIAKEISREVLRLDKLHRNQFHNSRRFCFGLQNWFPRLGMAISRRIFKQVINNTLGNSIKFLVTGGGYISDSTLNLFNSVGYPLANGYGTSEIGIISVELRNKPKYRALGSVGLPLKTVETKIENGHLFVRGTSTCSYFIYKDGTKVKLGGEWFDTLDIAKKDAKKYLYINGRADDIIVGVNGEKINPDLLEKKLTFSYVSNFVIAGIDHKTTLILQIPKHSNVFTIKSIIKEVKRNIERLNELGYNLEAIYYTYDALAPTNAIKVSRKVLNKLLDEKKIKLNKYSELSVQSVETQNETTNEVIKTIKKIFGCALNKEPEKIGNNDHFFLELGGTSLDYCTCFAKIQDEFNINIDMQDKKFVTVDEFSKYILEHKGK